MSEVIRREVAFAAPREVVWAAITDRETLAEWMFPNNFPAEARVGERFEFWVPGNPKVGFKGLTVTCELLACEEARLLVFSWSAGAGAGAVVGTRVSFRLEGDGERTTLFFEHSGFDLAAPMGMQAFKGAGHGWDRMLKQLVNVIESGEVR